MRSVKWTGLILGILIGVSAVTASAQGIVVQVRPPGAIVERHGRAPGRGYVWVPGYQRWDGRSYGWVPGRWVVPPRPHARWVPNRWVRHGNGWAFREGRWR
jgi:hypothetical protein